MDSVLSFCLKLFQPGVIRILNIRRVLLLIVLSSMVLLFFIPFDYIIIEQPRAESVYPHLYGHSSIGQSFISAVAVFRVGIQFATMKRSEHAPLKVDLYELRTSSLPGSYAPIEHYSVDEATRRTWAIEANSLQDNAYHFINFGKKALPPHIYHRIDVRSPQGGAESAVSPWFSLQRFYGKGYMSVNDEMSECSLAFLLVGNSTVVDIMQSLYALPLFHEFMDSHLLLLLTMMFFIILTLFPMVLILFLNPPGER